MSGAASFQKSHTMRLLFACLIISFSASAQVSDKAVQLFNDKKFDDAAKLFAGVKEGQKEYDRAQYYLGRICFSKNQLDDAEDHFETAIETNGKVADYHYWMGNLLGSIAQEANTLKQGMLAPKIKAAYEKTVELEPQHLGGLTGLIEFYTQAPGFMGGSWEKAEECAKRIMKFNPAEGHKSMAVIYQRQEKFSDAEREYVAAYKADPQYVHVLSNFYFGQKQYDKAFQLFESILKQSPDNMSIAYQYGKTCAISGKRLDLGEKYLLQYLSYTPKPNEPGHGGANMRLAQIKEKKGSKTEAKSLYEKALQLDATLKEAREGLARTK